MEVQTGLGWEQETRGCELSEFGVMKGTRRGGASR